MRCATVACVLATIASVGPASAQRTAQASPQVAAILACQSAGTDQERLRCYDQAARALAQATEQGRLVVVDREEIKRTRRSLFGFSVPKLPFFRGDDSQDNQPDFVEARIKSARPTGYNKWQVVLEDGAVWQTTEGDTRIPTPKAGDSIRIKQAAMGSYLLTFSRARPLRGMRVR